MNSGVLHFQKQFGLNMAKSIKQLVLPAVAVFFVAIVALSVFLWLQSRKPGSLVPINASISWTAPDTRDAMNAKALKLPEFKLVNRGHKKVRILSLETSCGCAPPVADKMIVDPGESAVVRVRATPLPAGERDVTVLVHTDSPTTAEVTLRLHVVSGNRPPFIVATKGDLYNLESSIGEGRYITVVTAEPQDNRNMPTVKTDADFVEVKYEGHVDRVYPFSNSVERSHRFRVLPIPDRLPEKFAGELRVIDPWTDKVFSYVNITTQKTPRLRVAPSRLILRLTNELNGLKGRSNQVEFLVVAQEGIHPNITAEPENGPSSPLQIERIPRQQEEGYYAFKVSLKPEISVSDGIYNIVVKESGSDTNQILLPVALKSETAQ